MLGRLDSSGGTAIKGCHRASMFSALTASQPSLLQISAKQRTSGKMARLHPKWPMTSKILLCAVSLICIFDYTDAASIANGRVTVIDNIPYYVGGVPVSQLLDVSTASFNVENLPAVDVIPMTVISSNASTFTGHDLNTIVSDYISQDDVFSSAFLSGK